jgi:hypothetical protein
MQLTLATMTQSRRSNSDLVAEINVARWDVGFGLIVIVVADKVFNGVRREEGFEFVVQLGGEGFVMGQNQCGAGARFDDFGNGKRLARAGDAEQGLMLFGLKQAARQLFDGGGLIAARLVAGC